MIGIDGDALAHGAPGWILAQNPMDPPGQVRKTVAQPCQMFTSGDDVKVDRKSDSPRFIFG